MSASKRKPIRKPGKKSGARINNTLAIKPLGIKTATTYELSAHAALLALEHGCATEDHLIHLFVLHQLCTRMSTELAVVRHAESIDRLCFEIKARGYLCGRDSYISMSASVRWLIDWLKVQKNIDIARHAHRAVRELSREIAE